MTWEIKIPYRSRDDLVLDSISAARQTLPDPEQRVVEVLARDALHNGILTVGALIDEIAARDAAGRRRLLDWAREQAGLITATEADKNRAFRRMLADDPGPPPSQRRTRLHREADGRAVQRCPACGKYPLGENGHPIAVRANKWWCGEHVHLAAPGDMADWEPPNPNRQSAEDAAADEAFYEEFYGRYDADFAERQEARKLEAEAIAAARQRYIEEGEVSMMGVRCRPDGSIIE